MKFIIILGLIVVGVVLFGQLSSVVEVANERIVEVEKTVEVEPDWAKDADAVKAAQDVIRKKELTAESESLGAQIKELQAKKAEVDKELGTYWRDPANVKKLIRETFPEDPATAIAIAHCESGLKPNAYNPKNNNGSTDGGLWQINSVHDARLQRLGLDKYDPEDATKFARMLYEENGGWMDWVCFTHNKLVYR